MNLLQISRDIKFLIYYNVFIAAIFKQIVFFFSEKKKKEKKKKKKKEKKEKKMTEKFSIHLFQVLAFSVCGKIYCKGTPL